ncbi:olfactory receptor 6B1-like [Spea bombifrons]|uniref:olfactory receptor 6B1-like n=1 Tax=Spea bombifrons TaxID=233779 RepID=UPI00234B0DD0|nr:olfactory receptor 6B1-like [Spea bombifrons]
MALVLPLLDMRATAASFSSSCRVLADYIITSLNNESKVEEFIILGFPGATPLPHIFFVLLMITYLVTLLSNCMIVLIISTEQNLQTPMYFYLRSFSLLEICYVSVIVPKLLATITPHGKLISFCNCIMQLFLFFYFAAAECFLLGIMAFDRYLAICNPLHYSALMSIYMCRNLMLGSWLGSFAVTFPAVMSISQLSFCGNNFINHFFCDAPPLLKLSCGNTSSSDLLGFISTIVVVLTSFCTIMFSYLYILRTVQKMCSSEGRKKAFSTCGSHLIVVVIYYSTVTFMYARPKLSFAFTLNRVVAVFYTVITPILNPMIYCLRNRIVIDSIRKKILFLKDFP